MRIPTEHYHQAVAEATRHHLESKTYSGKFLRPHAAFIKDLIIDRLEVRSILDYGAGKGRQYDWRADGDGQAVPNGHTIESYWGVDVAKYDPAWPPFRHMPEGRFDLVICTHVMGSIPCADLQWVVQEIGAKALKAVYFAEKLGDVGKQVFSQPGLMPRGWSRAQWADVLIPRGRPALEVWLATRQNLGAEGISVTRGRIQ